MADQQHNPAAIRVCAIADIQCSRGCGTGECKREREARYPASQPAAAPIDGSDGDLVLVERGLLGAACHAIEKKRDAPETLEKLRAITFAPRTAPSPADERATFEAKFPMPAQTERCGDGYSATGYNAWDAHKFIARWEGWKARAASANETDDYETRRKVAEALGIVWPGTRDGKRIGYAWSYLLGCIKDASANETGAEADHAQCCDTPSFCSSVRRCTAEDSSAPAIAATEAEIRKSMTSEQIQLERKLTCEAIDGAIAFGHQNTNPPPSADHWLAPYWHIGRKQAELESRSPAMAAEAVAIGDYDLNTSTGGRGYIAEFFAKRVRNHHYRRYIEERLAADFACTLAQYLRDRDVAPQPAQADARVGLTDEQILDVFRDAGLDLNATTNMLYAVRGQHAQLIKAARALLHGDSHADSRA